MSELHDTEDTGPTDFDDDDQELTIEFHANVSASPEFVYVVLDIDTGDLLGVSATFLGACEIGNTTPCDGYTAVPCKIDDPQWGNRPRN